jgi:RHS repeat-associated protein
VGILRSILNALILFAVLSCLAMAQTASSNPPDSMPNRGFYPLGSYSVSDIESVNNVTGNLTLSIPLAKLPPGRGDSSFGVALLYNSAILDQQESIVNGNLQLQYTASTTGGWRYGFQYSLGWDIRPIVSGSTCKESYDLYKSFIITPDGSRRNLRLQESIDNGVATTYLDNDGDSYFPISPIGDQPQCTTGQPVVPAVTSTMKLVYASIDSSYIRVEVMPAAQTWTMFLPNGTQVAGSVPLDQNNKQFTAPQFSSYPLFTGAAQTITDRNGNAIHITPSCIAAGPCTTTITDDLSLSFPERQIVITYGSQGDTITWPGAPQSGTSTTLTASIAHALTTFSTIEQQSGLQSQSYSCFPKVSGTCSADEIGAYQVDGSPQVTPGLQVVNSITLPAATAGGPQLGYTFTYACTQAYRVVSSPGWRSCSSAWGEIHSMTLPSTATVYYSYSYDVSAPSIRPAGQLINPVAAKQVSYTAASGDISATTQLTTYTYVWATTCPLGTQGCSSFNTNIISPDSSTTQYYYDASGLVNLISYYDSSGVQYTYGNNLPPGAPANINTNNYPSVGIPTNPSPNPYVSVEDIQNTNQKKTAEKKYSLDQNGNVTELDECGWITGTTSGACNQTNALRFTSNSYWVSTNAAGSSSDSSNAYWNTTAPAYLRALEASAITDVSKNAVVAATQYSYDSSSTTANLTNEYRWDNTKPSSLTYPGNPTGGAPLTLSTANSIHSIWSYVSRGNLQSVTDPNQNVIQLYYDNYNLYPTQVVDAGLRTFGYSFDGGSGYLLSSTDVDNSVSTTYTYDLIGRQTKVEEDDGVGLDRTSTTGYNDVTLVVTSKQDQASTGDQALTTTTYYDPLGRVFQTTDAAGNTVRKAYFYSTCTFCGFTYELTSNPYTSTSDVSMGWTLSTYGAVIPTSSPIYNQQTIQHYSGINPPIPSLTSAALATTGSCTNVGVTTSDSTACSVTTGDSASFIDEMGNTHSYTIDGLGRPTTVTEPNGIATTYTYDALDNLIGMGGRTFQYSSLSRLVSAKNLEGSIVSYQYDNNGNLLVETDGRGVLTCFGTLTGSQCASGYDGLNRPAKKSYSDSTPTVTYNYDQAGDTKGTLYSVTAVGTGSTVYTHDKIGRVLSSTQTTTGAASAFPFTYTYNLADFETSITYPSGHVVNYTPDSANRIAQIANPSKPQPYASGIQYSAAGAATQITLGNTLTEAADLNARLQPTAIALCPGGSCSRAGTPATLQATANNLITLQLGYNSSTNNGNIGSETITNPSLSINQSFTYDNLNRLKTVTEPGWSQTYTYDSASVGNRIVSGTWPPNYVSQFAPTAANNASYNSSNNQLTVSTGTSYDGSGNQKAIGGYQATFDAEGRMVSNTDNGATISYIYDGEGQRVAKVSCPSAAPCTATTAGATIQTVYAYDADGNLSAEYSPAPPTPPCTTCYVTVDHLGSTRVLTNGSGNAVSRYDYLPFGEEIPADGSVRTTAMGYQSLADGFNPKFTGQMRDTESRLDYFNARYFSSEQGRFISPDPDNAGTDVADPQSWNGYLYAVNNPLAYIDPSGLDGESPGGGDGGFPNGPPSTPPGGIAGPYPLIYLQGAQVLFNAMNATTLSLADSGPSAGQTSGAIGHILGRLITLLNAPIHAPTASDQQAWNQISSFCKYYNFGCSAAEAAILRAHPIVLRGEIPIGPPGSVGIEVLTRFGTEVETVEGLAQDAAKAEAGGFPHGVSTSARTNLRTEGSRALRSDVERHFTVKNTGGNLHRTVVLPKPVTKEIADLFNRLFGRIP